MWSGAEALAAAAASWMSLSSMSESSPWVGVPATISGARTAMEPSLPGRSFSLPPTREGRAGRVLLPVVGWSSGGSEGLRSVDDAVGRGRFWPAVDLGGCWVLGGGCF